MRIFRNKCLLPLALLLLLFGGCQYNDSGVWDELHDLHLAQQAQAERLAALEALKNTLNSNLSALQAVVTALQNNDYITGVTPFTEPAPGGYYITFAKTGQVTIRNGEKGADGKNGEDGADGQDGVPGKDGVTPQISVGEYPEHSGVYYWKLNGDWLTDDGTPTGNKIPVTGDAGKNGDAGEDGHTPTVAIGSDGYWYICPDGDCPANDVSVGAGWTYTGVKAVGEDGEDGQPGEDGHTPTVAIGSDGYWYICPDGDCPANDVSVGAGWENTGVKAAGEDGSDGQPGADGHTPTVAIGSDDNWYVCPTGACTGTPPAEGAGWTNTGTPATGAQGPQGDAIFAANGVDNSHDDYVIFTLAGGTTTIQVPKYRPLSINFTQPGTFANGETRAISLTLQGRVQRLTAVDVPRGWTVTPALAANKITVTAPANDGKYYAATGTATLLASDGAERTIAAPLALECPAYVAPEALDITFAQPAVFTAVNVPQHIGFTTSGGVALVSALDVPAGWTVAVSPLSGNAGTFTITFTNLTMPGGEALILAAGADGQSVMRTLGLPLIPPHAASTQTWTFGTSQLEWSDAILIPECNKDDFSNSDTEPRCRSYTQEGNPNTWYYYNWPYVDANAAILCPTPWRVPTWDDFYTLLGAGYLTELIAEWELSGFAKGGSIDEVGNNGYYWSSTKEQSAPTYANVLIFNQYSASPYLARPMYFGHRVRCVK